MDSSRNNNGKSNSYNSDNGDSKNDEEAKIAPPTTSNTIRSASLRPSTSRSSVASPYSKTWQLLEMDDHSEDLDSDSEHQEGASLGNGKQRHRYNLKPAPDSFLARSVVSSSSPPVFGLSSTGASNMTSLSVASSKGSSIYGTKNTRGSLEDDDPSDSAANIIDHLTISSSSVSVHSFGKASGRRMISAAGGMARSNGIRDDRKINAGNETSAQPFSSQKMSNFSNAKPASSHASSHRPSRPPAPSAVAQAPGETGRNRPKSNAADYNPMRKAPPKNDEDYNYGNGGVEERKEDSIVNDNERSMNEVHERLSRDFNDVSVGTDSEASTNQDEFVELAKERTRALLSASMSAVVSSTNDGIEIDASYIRNLTECCKKDQATLQGKLNEFFQENTDATDHFLELFGLSDEICAAIEAGEEALTHEKEQTKNNKDADCPTIDLLEVNRDVFSLICMLRAANDKRMLAALALMRFAKDDEELRKEIISSGGIHSFLTLFQQTRGITRELKVVASLAVAYILPSYVVSSQTTSSIGLKLVECLHFLAKSNPVSPNGIVITTEEMCKAASVGVNILWINAIQPLIAFKKAKDECSTSPPSLRPGKSVRYGRLRSRTG